ncbi:MAG: HD domain-containing protein [Burkholderiales bacterium]
MSTRPQDAIAAIEAMFAERGRLIYGERVTQLQHALQCATFAERAGALPSLIVAALLHDIGHMLHRDAEAALREGEDDHHESIGAKYLGRWFTVDVTAPIALHVQAKRYLCTVEAGYHALLSSVSKQSLAIQGGPMSNFDAATFAGNAYHKGAILLRRWDDEGKVIGMNTPPLSYFLPYVEGCLRLE